LSHLYIKINILPRQARDNYRENSKKVPFSKDFASSATLSSYNFHFDFGIALATNSAMGLDCSSDQPAVETEGQHATVTGVGEEEEEKTLQLFFAIAVFSTFKHGSFDKTGSGQM
jgi:hypothetical protein